MNSSQPVEEAEAQQVENRRLRASFPPVLRRWVREPLLHFVVLGGVLFAAYGYLHHGFGGATSRNIQLTQEDLNQLEAFYVSQWHREPTPQEFAGLIENRVRDEVLYREALRMGLDRDDTIVKRRMAQKVEFLSEDLADAHEPSTAELKAWYGKNQGRFAQPDQVTFRHVYFSPDRRGQRAHDDARAALAKIAGQREDARAAAALGDPFGLQAASDARTLDELAKDFGLPFAQAIFKVEPGSWQGPIQSGYGWHLVFVKSVVHGSAPAFAEIEPEVKQSWLAEQRSEQWRTVYAAMRAKYKVVLPATAPADAGRVAEAPAKPVALPSEGSTTGDPR